MYAGSRQIFLACSGCHIVQVPVSSGRRTSSLKGVSLNETSIAGGAITITITGNQSALERMQ